MLRLAIDTSSASTTCALVDGDHVLALREEVANNRHGELLAPMIESALQETGRAAGDIEAIAVGVGPGPFTGLRVGMMTAVAMGQALGVPVEGVCSLDAIAWADPNRPWNTGFAVLADARRREVYFASYDETGRVRGPEVSRPAALHQLPAIAFGAGAILHREVLPLGTGVDQTSPYPSAAAIAKLAADAKWRLPVRPLYLRRPDATPPGKPKSVTPA